MCVCVCVCVCVRVCARGWAGACVGGVRFSNSNRIIPSDYRILLLLKMPIPSLNQERSLKGDSGCASEKLGVPDLLSD